MPGDFSLSVKAPRGLTHARKLYGPETWLQRIGAGWHELGDKRAVLLAQLGPAQPRDDARLAYFLRLVPEWIRVAVEFRHSSWHCEEVFALLEAHRAAYCVMSGAGQYPGMGHGRPRRFRLLQQRRPGECRARCPGLAAAPRPAGGPVNVAGTPAGTLPGPLAFHICDPHRPSPG